MVRNFRRTQIVFDPRTKQYLFRVGNPAAIWTPDREQATLYSPDTISVFKRDWPYLDDCEIIDIDREAS